MHDVSQGRVEPNNADSTVFSVHTHMFDTKEGLTTAITIGCLSKRVLYKRHYKVFEVSCDKYSAKISAVQDLNLRPSDLQSLALPT